MHRISAGQEGPAARRAKHVRIVAFQADTVVSQRLKARGGRVRVAQRCVKVPGVVNEDGQDVLWGGVEIW